LYKYIAKHVRYPTNAYVNNVQGKVFAVFNIDDDHKISNVKILRGLADSQNDEVVRVLKNYPATDLKPGVKYAIPISFSLQNKAGQWVDSETYKAPQPYVGGDYKPNNYPTVYLNEVVVVGFKN
jgi:hypothetical protein